MKETCHILVLNEGRKAISTRKHEVYSDAVPVSILCPCKEALHVWVSKGILSSPIDLRLVRVSSHATATRKKNQFVAITYVGTFE